MGNNLTTSLSGLNALVCGSTSGIGLATAQEFAESSANVTLFARNEEKLKHTLSTLQISGAHTHLYIVGDFNNPSNIQKKIKSHILSGNKYHILINSGYSITNIQIKYM